MPKEESHEEDQRDGQDQPGNEGPEPMSESELLDAAKFFAKNVLGGEKGEAAAASFDTDDLADVDDEHVVFLAENASKLPGTEIGTVAKDLPVRSGAAPRPRASSPCR